MAEVPVKWEYLKWVTESRRIEEPTGERGWLGNPKTFEVEREMGEFNGEEVSEEDGLRMAGEEGWELVTVYIGRYAGQLTHYFKRVKR